MTQKTCVCWSDELIAFGCRCGAMEHGSSTAEERFGVNSWSLDDLQKGDGVLYWIVAGDGWGGGNGSSE